MFTYDLNATLFKGDLLESYESPTIFAQSDIMCHWADVNKKEWNTCTKSNDFSSWCFRPGFCPTKWPNIATKWPNIDNVKTCTKSNLCRTHDFRWCFHHMNQRGGVFCLYVLPHRSYTGFTESYESLKEWNQDIDFSDFDQNNEWVKIPRKKIPFSRCRLC